jgi:hypothetical protein
MFGGRKRWTERAVLLAETLCIYEASLCASCGQSTAIALNPLNTGHFRVDDSSVCLGCEALQHRRDRTSEDYPGTKLYVVNDLGVTDG